MRQWLSDRLVSIADWIAGAKAEPLVTATGSGYTPALDSYGRLREPSLRELVRELKNTAWVCATMNASVCADHPPCLYLKTRPGETKSRWPTKAIQDGHPLAVKASSQGTLEEVVEHPLLDLFHNVNPVHNARDLWELLTLYQETTGNAYWLLGRDGLNTPSTIWPVPAHHMRAVRELQSTNLVDYYEYTGAAQPERYSPDEIIHFMYPDPREPYLCGRGPLQAAWEDVSQDSLFKAHKRAVWDNRAAPGVVLTPDEPIGEDEAQRTEERYRQRFGRGNNGRVMVSESGLKMHLVSHSLADVAALAESGFTKEQIINAFGCPLSFFTKEVNLANLQAARGQHLEFAIAPRINRRDQKLNERLVPMFDNSGRLFLATPNVAPEDQEFRLKQDTADLSSGKRTINELRKRDGHPPVSWGDEPYRVPQRIISDNLDDPNRGTQS